MKRALITVTWGCSACVSVGAIHARGSATFQTVLRMIVDAHDTESPACSFHRKLRFATSIDLPALQKKYSKPLQQGRTHAPTDNQHV